MAAIPSTKVGFMKAFTRMYMSRKGGPSGCGGPVYTRVNDDFGSHYGAYRRPAGVVEQSEAIHVYVLANRHDILRGRGGVFWGLPFASVGLTFLGWGNVCCHRPK
jgi:hypothetical protein